jgi:hypothetical protein
VGVAADATLTHCRDGVASVSLGHGLEQRGFVLGREQHAG